MIYLGYTCIYIIKQKPPKVLERFQTIDISDVGISSITVAELEYWKMGSEGEIPNFSKKSGI
jgi:tRNA(fMet)-specific endonuclease VapC